MAYLALSRLGSTCKLCVGIYAASAVCLVAAVVAWQGARRAAIASGPAMAPRARRREHADPAWTDAAEPLDEIPGRPARATSPTSWGALLGAFAVGVAFVVLPVALYASSAPRHERFVGTCGALAVAEDTHDVMVPLDPAGPDAVPAIEIVDPLCPACRAFETRLASSDLSARLARRGVMFPLDKTCNWMVAETMHPGACAVSEAVLCAGDRAAEVMDWAFAEQERIRTATLADPAAAARLVGQRFPELAACVGSPAAKARLNKSLRWAVQNSVPVMTPQLYVDGVKLCDEDVDLGLEYTLTAMLEQRARGTLRGTPPPPAPVPAVAEAPPPAAKPAPAPSAPTATEPPAEPEAEPTPPAEPTPAAEPPAAEPEPAPAAETTGGTP
jgi:hypothetical protein